MERKSNFIVIKLKVVKQVLKLCEPRRYSSYKESFINFDVVSVLHNFAQRLDTNERQRFLSNMLIAGLMRTKSCYTWFYNTSRMPVTCSSLDYVGIEGEMCFDSGQNAWTYGFAEISRKHWSTATERAWRSGCWNLPVLMSILARKHWPKSRRAAHLSLSE